MKAKELKFLATPEKGEVSALLLRPLDAKHLLVLSHGASTNMQHATLQTVLSGRMYMSRGQAEQPFGRGLNFRLGNPGA